MMETKRIVITGSSGFLGQHLLHALMTKGPSSKDSHYEIFSLYGQQQGFATNVVAITPHSQVTVTFDRLDIAKESEVKQWVSANKPLDICLHFAAVSSPAKCQENVELAQSVNCPSCLFAALAEAKVSIVALSTDQVYDGKSAPYLETDKVGPVNVYGQTKVAMETSLQELLPTTSVELRSSIILGPEAPFGNAHGTFLHFCKSRADESTHYFTDECRSVISVSDVISILTYFIEKGVDSETAGIYNMGGKDGASRYDIALATARYLDIDEKLVVAKARADQPPGKVPSPLDIAMDSSKLSTLIGFSFKGLDEIVEETFVKTT